jgi:hypothetical protein
MTTDSTITPELLDQLLANNEKPKDLTGENGLFKQLKKALANRGEDVLSYRCRAPVCHFFLYACRKL